MHERNNARAGFRRTGKNDLRKAITRNKPLLRRTRIIAALLLGPIAMLFSVKLVGLNVADNLVRYQVSDGLALVNAFPNI